MKTRKRRISILNRNRRGVASVEFAMIAPAFLVVVFCSIEFARMSMMRNLAQNAAYESARFTMVEGATAEDAKTKAEEILARLGTKGAVITINDGQPLAFDTPFIKTEIEIPLNENSLVFPKTLFDNKKIYATTTLRTERYRGFFDSENN